MNIEEQAFNALVKKQINSGVKPLELLFYPIVHVDGAEGIAFRSETRINSIIMGALDQSDYISTSDYRPCGLDLLKHNVRHAIATLKEFDKSKRRCDFVSVRCPTSIFDKGSFYNELKAVLEKNPSVDPQRICIEFTEDLLELDVEKAKIAVLDMKLLKLRTALVGVGKEESKISKLVQVPVDLAILDKSVSKWAGDRNKPQLFDSLLSYIKAMDINSVVEGNEEQKGEMHFSDVVGFMFEGTEPINLESALAMAEEVLF